MWVSTPCWANESVSGAQICSKRGEPLRTPVRKSPMESIASLSYLAALQLKERTKRNHRDTIGFFNRWLVLRGFLSQGTDWLEGGVQEKLLSQGSFRTG